MARVVRAMTEALAAITQHCLAPVDEVLRHPFGVIHR
jgi:hypothetical protein